MDKSGRVVATRVTKSSLGMRSTRNNSGHASNRFNKDP